MVQGMDDMPGGGKVIKAEFRCRDVRLLDTLRSMSQGRATYTMEFKHYSEAPKNVATRSSLPRQQVIQAGLRIPGARCQ